MEYSKKVGRFGISSIILLSAIMAPIVFLFVFPLLNRIAAGENLITILDNMNSTDDLGRVLLGIIGAGIFGTVIDLAWLIVHRKENEWELKSVIFKSIAIGFLAALLPTYLASIISG